MSQREGDDDALSAGAKIGATIGGFLAFYALLLTLLMSAALIGASDDFTPVGIAILLAAVYAMVRIRSRKTGRARLMLGWAAFGFTAAMVVFGGCVSLLNSL